MNLGMIGAIGGLGQAAIGQGDYLRRQEEADAEVGRRKNLEQWLMAARDEYAIKSENRAADRTIATEKRTDEREDVKDAKTWQRRQERAPVEREIKVADETASADGKLKFETQNIGTLASNKTTLTEAGETQSTRDLRKAQVGYYNDRGDAAAAKADDALAKLPPALKAELAGLDSEIKDTAKDIKKAKIEGSWTGTPEQKAIESQLAAQRLRRAAILRQAGSPSAAPPADPLNLRKPAKGEKTGMVDNPPVNSSAIESGEQPPFGNASATRYVTDGSYKDESSLAGKFAGEGKPATAAKASTGTRLPRSLAEIPGVKDESIVVNSAADLLPPGDPRIELLRSKVYQR